MDPLRLSNQGKLEMKSFYQEELARTLRRLAHINEILSQLGEGGSQIRISTMESGAAMPKSTSSSSKRKYKKKRGPKSKWDKAIMKTITNADRPLSYDELTNFLLISEGRDNSKRKNTKATVQNTVFRMRHDGRVNTFSMGDRTKYIGPKNWFDENGVVLKEYKSKVSTPKKKAAAKSKKTKKGPGRPKSKIAKKTVEKKASPKKPATKKAVVKKAVAKKAVAKKAVAKKVVAKKVVAKKAVAKKAIAKKAPAKKEPTAKAVVNKTPAKKEVKAKASPKKSKVKAKPVAKKSSTSSKRKTSKKALKPTSPAKTRKVAMKKTVK